jgi:hypothetical protein
MKFVILLAAVVLVNAQEPAPKSPSTPTAESSQPAVDARLHQDVLKLIELTGVRAALQNGTAQGIGEGKVRVMQACNGCAPEFGDEWAKRMLARTKIDDYVDVYVRVYEKYFNDDEIRQLIVSQNEARNSQPQTISDALKQKLTAQFPSVQSEIIGGTAQVGSKLGGEIGAEIQKEHPEYFKQPASPPK